MYKVFVLLEVLPCGQCDHVTWTRKSPTRGVPCSAPLSPGIRSGRQGVLTAVQVEPKGGQMHIARPCVFI